MDVVLFEIYELHTIVFKVYENQSSFATIKENMKNEWYTEIITIVLIIKTKFFNKLLDIN